MLVAGNSDEPMSVGAAEVDVITRLPCCPLRDAQGNQLLLGLTVQVTGVQPLQQADASTDAADADSDTTNCDVAQALVGATLSVRVVHDLGDAAAAQLTVVLR